MSGVVFILKFYQYNSHKQSKIKPEIPMARIKIVILYINIIEKYITP